mgnify:CR=1 FL=1
MHTDAPDDGLIGPTVADGIHRFGSIRFDEFVELALYGPDGFYSSGGGAGRAGGDFVTSPEVGPLFGAVVARWLDATWGRLGRPDEFVVVEAAAGRGALALAVLAAEPECAAALRYVLVERSAALRARQAEFLALAQPFEVLGPTVDDDEIDGERVAPVTGPLVVALPDLPAQPIVGAVIANELLDNLAFRLLERASDRWYEVRVAGDGDAGLVELLVPADAAVAVIADELVPEARPGCRIPIQSAAADWLRRSLDLVERGSVLVFDYAVAETSELAERPVGEWLRTYAAHDAGGGPLDAVGRQDVTVEVAVDQLASVVAPSVVSTQSEWLRTWGIDELVDAGRRVWEERAGSGDLAAMRARSRVVEAEALCDPIGLGAFTVLEWHRP